MAIDVGAHKGGYFYWMQKRVKQGGKLQKTIQLSRKVKNHLINLVQKINNGWVPSDE